MKKKKLSLLTVLEGEGILTKGARGINKGYDALANAAAGFVPGGQQLKKLNDAGMYDAETDPIKRSLQIGLGAPGYLAGAAAKGVGKAYDAVTGNNQPQQQPPQQQDNISPQEREQLAALVRQYGPQAVEMYKQRKAAQISQGQQNQQLPQDIPSSPPAGEAMAAQAGVSQKLSGPKLPPQQPVQSQTERNALAANRQEQLSTHKKSQATQSAPAKDFQKTN